MKKRALVTIFLFFSALLTFVQAEEKNGWYLGTKLGWSHVNPLKYNFHISKNIENDTSKENLKAPIVGFFLGYEFNPYIGFEMENDTNGFKPYLAFHKKEKHSQNNSLQLSTKLSYPVRDNFYLYTKLGGLVFWENLSSKQDLKNMITKESSIFPSISLGAEYVFNKNFFTRLDYTWKNSVKNISEASVKPSLGNTVLSFGWKFGNTDSDDLFLPYDSKFFNTPHTVLSENINFPFNSTELKPIAHDKLNKLDEDIKNMRLKNLSIVVIGHSDKMGTEEYNQRLSEDRAYSIKNYLTSRGFSRNQITIQGMGNLYPLTDQVCKDIENRPLLISCLAPDRRVEIEVLSK